MYRTLEEFINYNVDKKELTFDYKSCPIEIKNMLKNLYSCCFRFGLYRNQIILILNKATEPFKQNEGLFDL